MTPSPPFDDTPDRIPVTTDNNAIPVVVSMTASVHSNGSSLRKNQQQQQQFQKQQQLVSSTPTAAATATAVAVASSVKSTTNSCSSSRRRSSVCSIHSVLMEDVEKSRMDCTICLDPMTMVDYKHPLQCEFRQCGFNFCMNCIESLITSSKDDFQMSSDGNRHVKVYLHCPNCRSDLGWTIRDTLLLRKADFILMNEESHIPDNQLSASYLRLKNEIHKPQVQHAIKTARKLEAEFFGKQLEEIHNKAAAAAAGTGEANTSSSSLVQSSFRGHEEWGVEADLLNGVHSSIRLPKNQQFSIQPEPLQADKTLLQGLDYAMTEDEQKYFTQMMTSGDVEKLAESARQLYEISKMAMRGISVTQRLRKRSSIYVLIDEAEEAHAKHEVGSKAASMANIIYQAQQQPQYQNVAKTRATLLKEAEFMKFHPLPVRMPKYCELPFGDVINCSRPFLSSFDEDDDLLDGPISPVGDGGIVGALPFSCGPKPTQFPVGFADDTWDGSVMDAFCKITIHPLTGQIQKHSSRLNHHGVVNVLAEGHDLGDTDSYKNFGIARIDVETPRVLISQVSGDAGKEGIMKGDVVTHIDDECVLGWKSSQVVDLLYKKKLSGTSGTFAISLNSDKATAEALKRRAAAVSWW